MNFSCTFCKGFIFYLIKWTKIIWLKQDSSMWPQDLQIHSRHQQMNSYYKHCQKTTTPHSFYLVVIYIGLLRINSAIIWHQIGGTLNWLRFPICPKNVISKVALLQYYAKLIHHDAEQWPEWTVDISLTHTHSIKAGYSKWLLGMHQFTHSYWKKVQLLKSHFSDKSSWISANLGSLVIVAKRIIKSLCKLQQDNTIYFQVVGPWTSAEFLCLQRVLQMLACWSKPSTMVEK